jgi:hypothetical protein
MSLGEYNNGYPQLRVRGYEDYVTPPPPPPPPPIDVRKFIQQGGIIKQGEQLGVHRM